MELLGLREALKRLIDGLNEDRLPLAARLLRRLRDPALSGQDVKWLEAVFSEPGEFPGSPAVKQAMRTATEEAQRAGCLGLDAEHFLIGILLADPAAAEGVLSPSVNIESIIDDLRKNTPQGPGVSLSVEHLPWSKAARDAWTAAYSHARGRHGRHFVDAESLMVGLMQNPNSIVSAVLERHGIHAGSTEAAHRHEKDQGR